MPVPVSYTHLDVYKRQVLRTFERPEGNMEPMPFTMEDRQMVEGNVEQNIPVSYTHLDVYKRQPFVYALGERALIPTGLHQILSLIHISL